MEARSLRAVLCIGGVVASAAGLHTMLAGARSIPGIGQNADPVTESELRFYSAFYLAYGVKLLSLAHKGGSEPASVDAISGPLFMSGLARIAGWRSVGRPNRTQLVLLGIEVGLAPVLPALARAAEKSMDGT